MSEPARIAAVVWYRREDYPRVLTIMEDAHLLPPTWEKWRYSADKVARQAQKSGVVVEKVYLHLDDFLAWCRARGLNVDAKARTAFANECAARKHGAID